MRLTKKQCYTLITEQRKILKSQRDDVLINIKASLLANEKLNVTIDYIDDLKKLDIIDNWLSSFKRELLIGMEIPND